MSHEFGTKITVAMGDITEETSSAIVCSANPFLDAHGGLANHLIHKGGNCIKEECEDIIDERVMIPTGSVEVTLAGRLHCKYIIHVVGPNMNEPSQLGIDKNQLMEYSVNNILTQAEELECKSLSIPAISTGSFGFPRKKCAQVMFKTVIDFLCSDSAKHLKEVRFINVELKTAIEFVKEFDEQFTADPTAASGDKKSFDKTNK